MNDFKKIINENIIKATNRKNVFIIKDPNNVSSIRYWDGYITALQSVVSLFPDEVEYEQEELFASNNSSSSGTSQ